MACGSTVYTRVDKTAVLCASLNIVGGHHRFLFYPGINDGHFQVTSQPARDIPSFGKTGPVVSVSSLINDMNSI